MISSIFGLCSGSDWTQLRMRPRNTWFVTRATCSLRWFGSGISRVHISHRRTPKLYTSIYQQKQHYKYLGHLLQQHYSLQTFLTSVAGGFFLLSCFLKQGIWLRESWTQFKWERMGEQGRGQFSMNSFFYPILYLFLFWPLTLRSMNEICPKQPPAKSKLWGAK